MCSEIDKHRFVSVLTKADSLNLFNYGHSGFANAVVGGHPMVSAGKPQPRAGSILGRGIKPPGTLPGLSQPIQGTLFLPLVMRINS